MATDNQRDPLRPANADDFAFDNVPDYTLDTTRSVAETEAFPASVPATGPAAGAATGFTTGTTSTTSTAATTSMDRAPQYISPADPVYDEVAVTSQPVVEETVVGRGTIDFGLMLLRLLVGGYLVLRSISTFFNLGSSGGIGALETAYADYAFGNGLAIIVPTLELAAGVFLILGLITPVATAVAVAVTAFEALHSFAAASGDWSALLTDASVLLPTLIFGLALVLTFTGPGLYGVDTGRGWARRPLASSWISALIGLAAAGAMWWFGTGINPFA